MIETTNHTMVCLICEQVIKTIKGDNAKQHYRHHVNDSDAKMEGDSRKTSFKITFNRFLSLPNMRVEASYKVAHILGVAGRKYMDGEIVKKCIVETVKLINPDKESDFAEISFSRVTIQCLQSVDELTDICDSAQLLIFVRSLSPDFIIHEDLISMETLCGVDIFEAVKKSCRDSNLDMKNVRDICNDGAPAMIGRKQGFVARLTEYVGVKYKNNRVTNNNIYTKQFPTTPPVSCYYR
ncbi:hypothetical protein A3Q56_08167 [Intoshia linei]|uniref:DUF4371 domain-containing protein n=1 Tax=Intoshia linei TaxID=1819745 RepID=A0A177ARX1_9BILA|nr:hypothetical protein A3Q56_08167 [Intoshia linei]